MHPGTKVRSRNGLATLLLNQENETVKFISVGKSVRQAANIEHEDQPTAYSQAKQKAHLVHQISKAHSQVIKS